MDYTPQKRSRYERKFVVQAYSRYNLESIVKTHPAGFSEIYFERNINNIYLDTPNLTFYLDNVIGKASRKKVRIRWYGDLLGEVKKPVLEFKIKSGVVGDKLSFPLVPFVLDKNFSIDILKQVFAVSELPDWVREELIKLEPRLLNRYKRKYFLSFDKSYRITLDHSLEYHDIARRHSLFNRHTFDYQNTVLELKYNFDKDNDADRIANIFPFRLSKSSKYVNGIEQFSQGIAV